MQSLLVLAAAFLPLVSCRTPANALAVEDPKIDAVCIDVQQSDQAKCTDYQALLVSLEASFASSCQEQGGAWKSGGFRCKVVTGTRGCRREASGGGPTVTTWYTGEGFKTTEIQCPDMVLVTK